MELSEEEQIEVKRLLNTIPEDELNLIAMDYKYDKAWYAEHLRALRRINAYLTNAEEVLNASKRHSAERTVKTGRDELEEVINLFEKAIEEFDNPYTPYPNI